MLESLYLKNFLLIKETYLEFKPGMTVLTGETGAGKSILINALSLILGARGSADWVRKPKTQAQLRAVFNIEKHQAAQDKLSALQIEHDGELIIRRILQTNGKSKSYINDTPVTLTVVKSLGKTLVAIYGQHSHQSLTKSEFQRQSLDRFAGINDEVAEFAGLYAEYQDLLERQKAILLQDKTQADRAELLQYQLREFTELDLQQGEYDELNLEQKRLSQAEQAAEKLGKIHHRLAMAESNLISGLQLITQDAVKLAELYPELANASELLDLAAIQMQEAAAEIKDKFERIEINPGRLAEVDARLGGILDLARKHQAAPPDILAVQIRLQEELERLQNQDALLENLKIEIKNILQKLNSAAKKISSKRTAAASQLQKMVTAKINLLGMQGAEFKVKVQPLEDINQHGKDKVMFAIAANPGQGFSAISACASGGELSRLGLAIQVCITQDADLPVMVFDEVDAGIGGTTADTVGGLLQQLSCKVQILCVTHLTQIASRAARHFRVTKKLAGVQVYNEVENLRQNARAQEIARMLGGKATTKALQHANELLGLGKSYN